MNLSTNTGGCFSGGAIESQKVFDGYFLQLRRGSPRSKFGRLVGGLPHEALRVRPITLRLLPRTSGFFNGLI